MKSFVFVNLICCITNVIDFIHLNKVFLMPTTICTTVEMVIGCLPSLNPSQSSFSGDGITWMFFAASRERMLYHPNATAILKVWPLSVQCALCINNIFPTEQTIGKLDYQLWSIFSCCSRTSINIHTFLSEAIQLQVEWFFSIVGWNNSIRCKKFQRIDLYQLRVRWNFLVKWRRANCLAVLPQQRHMDRLPCNDNDNDKDKYRDKDKGLPLAVLLQRLRSL